MAYHFESVKLDKGMYHEHGRSFSEVLERADPSEQYKGTSLEHLDPFQRQLKRFDIKVKGAACDNVSKFFASWESAVLFPEYVSRAVRQGMEESNLIPLITATETRFDGLDYRAIASNPSEDAKTFQYVSEGAQIPATEIRTQDNMVKLHKRGRMLIASYEAIQFQKLDTFAVTLRQIGAYINRMHLQDAVSVLMDGDGNGNPAEVMYIGKGVISGTAGTLSYPALVDFWNTFDPYTMNTLLVSPDVMSAMLKLPEMQIPQARGLDFQASGNMLTPMGATLLKSATLPAGTLIGLDKNYALELIRATDILVEYDKLIDRQLERAAITSISGFSKIFPDASKVLRLSAGAKR